MLQIKDLHVSVNNKPILKGLSLNVNPGEVHAIMGPNGSGKSTLSYVLAGKDGYEVTQGSIQFKNVNLTELQPEERARQGIFLAMQYPVELPGVNNLVFLRESINAIRRSRNEPALDAVSFLRLAKEKARQINLDESLLKRSVNSGFSGGEKKRNEILQLALLEPQLAILDETDSGLDIDALKTIAESINAMRDPSRSIVVVTHYQRLLNFIEPDKVHVLLDGTIARTGDKHLAIELEEKGYNWIANGAAA